MADGTIYDLSSFPAPEVIQTLDAEDIIARMAADMVGRYPDLEGVIDLESEPVRKLIEVFAFREIMVRTRVNDAARANLLAFAAKNDLDHLGVFYDVTRMAGELDAPFKRRIILAIMGRSTGGTEPRYRAVALGASTQVADAVVYREGTSPVVNVAVYSTTNGGVADASLLTLVRTALNAPAVRMVSDTIVVRSAAFTTVNIVGDVWLLPETSDVLITPVEPTAANPNGDSPLAAGLRSAWAKESGLGFDMIREWIAARLMVSGVQKAAVVSPVADVIAPPHQAVALGTITLTNKGRAY